MSSSASVDVHEPLSSTGSSSLKTMRLLSSNWLAEQLSTRRAHPVIMNSRALLFQASNTTEFWSQEIKDGTTFRVQDELSSNDSTALINTLGLCSQHSQSGHLSVCQTYPASQRHPVFKYSMSIWF